MNRCSFDPLKVTLRGIVSSEAESLEDFTCSNGSMDNFLKFDAYLAHLEREASTTLVYYESKVIAYFSLKRSKIRVDGIQDDINALDLARLAVDENYQGIGVGTFILARIREIADMVNERYIQTDALWERWKWYENRGFNHIIDEEIDEKFHHELVYMIMDVYDEELIREYFDE